MYTEIEQIICRHFGVSVADIHDKGRKREVVDARHFTWYVLHVIMSFRLKFIAEEYGVTLRNVSYAISDIKSGVRTQRYYREHYTTIIGELKSNDIQIN